MGVDFLPFRAHLNAQSGRFSTLDLYTRENPRSMYTDDAVRAVCAPANLQLLEHSGAAGEHVAVGGIEIAGIPGIGHVAGAIGPVE